MNLTINLRCTDEELDKFIVKAVEALKKEAEKKHGVREAKGVKKYTIVISDAKEGSR